MNKKYKILLWIFFIFVLVFSSIFIKNFRVDASSDTLVAQNDEDFQFFNYYQEIFPTKNNLVVAIKSSKEIDKKLLDEINIISEKILNINDVSSVFNINRAPVLFLNNTSLIDLSNNNYETILNTDHEIKDVLDEFTKSPIYANQIINNNKNITSIIIFLKENKKTQDLKDNKNLYLSNGTYYDKKNEIDYERKILIKEIRDILKESSDDYDYYLGGIEMISNDIISFVKNDIIIFSLLVVSLVIIILFSIFRKIKWVFVILSSSIFSVYSMLGLIGFLKFEITAISANSISLMFILSVSMNIHILNHYLQTKNELIKTLKIMFWPCFYTFLTTLVAFLSLTLSEIKPVIDFGLIMIIALIIILLSSFTILPFFISFFIKDMNKKYINFSIIQSFTHLANKFKIFIIGANISLFIISIYGITNLNVENSFIKYFKKSTEIYKGMKLIDSQLGGTTPLDIVLELENEDIVKNNNITDDNFDEEMEFEDDIFSEDLFEENNEIWFTDTKINTIKKIHLYLENRSEIGKVTSIYSLVDVANKINKNELSSFELSILYNEIPEEYKEDLIYPYISIDNNMVKVSARVKDSEDIKRAELIEDIKNYAKNNFENINEVKINGLLVLYNNMLSSLFTSQLKSLGFVLLAIFIMFIILFRSIKLSILGIIPNIFASTFILGIIGLLKIPLDIMTITVAAISIGIAVDNTIHYLYRYKINISESLDKFQSIERAHSTVGKAVLITSMAISLGFLTLCFSNFIPTIIFGLFTSLAMIFAMIGVLITLPSILYYSK